MKSGNIEKSGGLPPINNGDYVTKKYADENDVSSIAIDTIEYVKTDGIISLPTIDMIVTFEDETVATYKVVANE